MIPSLRYTARALLVLAALLVVFYLYSRPDFLLQMANQLWTCI